MHPAVQPISAASAPAASPSSRVRGAFARFSSLLLIALFLLGSAWPSVFKVAVGFALFAMLLMVTAIGPVTNPAARSRGQVLTAMLLFVAYGAVILALSALKLFDIDPKLPVRTDYMLRQAYFLFLWLPFLYGAASFWTALASEIFGVCRRWGLVLLAALAALDLVTSRLFGDPNELLWAGYTSYFDKFGFQFVFSLTYLIYIAHSRHWVLCLLLITAYAALSKLLDAGIMFNATTGTIFFLFLVTSSIPLVSRQLKATGVISIYLALIAFLMLGILFPHLFSGDRNDEWRLMAWRSNFSALWESGLAGLGFGTPYFTVTAENMLNSMSNQFNSLSADLINSVDPQYVRAQHSSIVNMFYRLGIVGGALFVYMNVLIVRIGLSGLRHRNSAIARMSYVALVLFVAQTVQMTVHVGLETPIFLSIYMLSVALILHVNAVGTNTPESVLSTVAVGRRSKVNGGNDRDFGQSAGKDDLARRSFHSKAQRMPARGGNLDAAGYLRSPPRQ